MANQKKMVFVEKGKEYISKVNRWTEETRKLKYILYRHIHIQEMNSHGDVPFD